MNLHGKDIKIFAGNASHDVAAQIAQRLGLPLGKSSVDTFSDGEISVSIFESVRGSDVFVVQSTCQPVNNNIMELLILIDAFKRASAGRITAVIPYYGYARQDRKRPDFGQTYCRPYHSSRCGPRFDNGFTRTADSGLLQYTGRPLAGRADTGPLFLRKICRQP